MEAEKKKRKNMTLSPRATAVLNGTEDVSQWDDEELARGRRRDKFGRFGGQPPKVVPVVCVQELNRRKLFETNSIIRDACTDAASYLRDVVKGVVDPNVARQRACDSLLDRFVGKPTERIEAKMSVQGQVESLPWVQAFKQAIRMPDGRRVIEASATELPAPSDDDIVDAEVVEDSWGVPPGARAMPIEDDPILEDDDDPVLTDDDDFIEPPPHRPTGRTRLHNARIRSSGPAVE